MRTTHDAASVRLYQLGDGEPVAETLLYGPLAEAMAVAAAQPADVQARLWIATNNDVVHYLDLVSG
jgi:hypothetical protein